MRRGLPIPFWFHRGVVGITAVLGLVFGGWAEGPAGDAYEVHPGEELQAALDRAAADPVRKIVRVHAGTYFPKAPAQALIRFQARHDGLRVEAVGEVTLAATNSAVADREAASFPAVVNHIVYFGDGITGRTVLRGFTLTGGNNFVTDREGSEPLEPNFAEIIKTDGVYGHLFFYTDGAAIKVFGRSTPTLVGLTVRDNYAAPCAGGISVEHRGLTTNAVVVRDCVFRDNRALVTGAAVDLLPGSYAVLTNCLFVGNLSNRGNEHRPVKGNLDWPNIPALVRSAAGYLPEHGSGALTVFPRSAVRVERCTFTGNSNGVDDYGGRSVYRDCLFWMNTAAGAARPGGRYELDVPRARAITGCFVHGATNDLRGSVDPAANTLACPDPEFDARFRPRNPRMANVGYAPPGS